MRIGVVGGGTVGHATARCWMEFAEVRVYDEVAERATHQFKEVIESDVVFVCVPEGNVEDVILKAVCERGHDAAKSVNLVVKSTVPIGTTRMLAAKYELTNLVHSPEFLTARTAVEDAANPRVNVVGYAGDRGGRALEGVYHDRWPGVPVWVMSSDESEAVKLFMNSFFAVKVAFFNECRALADKLKLDWESVRETMLADRRIHPLHTQVPGPDGKRGFGGACLPKDLKQLIGVMMEHKDTNVFPHVCKAAHERNIVDRRRR